MIMDEVPRPASKNPNKRNKRKRTPKKPRSDGPTNNGDGDGKSAPPSSHGNDSKNDGQDVRRKFVTPNKSAKTKNASNEKVGTGKYPYPTDYNDHFETPARAYDDIFPLLEYTMAKKQTHNNNKKKKSSNKEAHNEQGNSHETIIYDPYYCAGRAAILISDVFQRHQSENISSTIKVQHEKRDFYRDILQNAVPKYDILITNPPYSGDHKEKCLEFAVNRLRNHGLPFFLLMPNYVATKDYFRKIVVEDNTGSGTKRIQTFYITPPPNNQYEYDHPEGTGHQISPFASVWFCGMSYGEGKTQDMRSVMDAFARFHSSNDASYPMGTARIASNLQNLIRMGGVSAEKRKNPRQRKKIRQQAMQKANNAAMGGVSVGSKVGQKGGQAKTGERKASSHMTGHSKKEGGNNKKRRKFK